MKSKNYQLMLLAGALTVSFAAHAANVNNNVVKDNDKSAGLESTELETKNTDGSPVEDIAKSTDANVYGHVIDAKTGEHVPYVTIRVMGTTIATTTDISSSRTCLRGPSSSRRPTWATTPSREASPFAITPARNLISRFPQTT